MAKKWKWMLRISVFMSLMLGLVGFKQEVWAEVSQTSPQVAENDRLLEEIKERGVLRFGTASGYAPFEFTVLENGKNKVVGSDIFLAQAIADAIGVRLEIVDMEFGSLIPAMESGSIDIIIAGMSYTPERDKTVDFSHYYNQDNQFFVIKKKDQDRITGADAFKEGGKIGVSDNTLQATLVSEKIPTANKVTMRKSADAISALISGQVEAVLLDESVAKAFAAEHEDLLAIPSGLDVSADGKSVAVPDNQPQLLAVVNDTVDRLVENGKMDEFLEQSYTLIRENQKDSWLKYWPYFWDGIKVTVIIATFAVAVGVVLGFFLALMRLSDIKILQVVAASYVEFVRGTPMMVQVLFIFLSLGATFSLSSLWSGMIAVALNSGAYVCEIFRGGIKAVDKGQMEAARSLGLSYWATMRKVIFPQSLRSIWPSLGNEFITLLKDSSIVSTIGVAELTFQTRAVTSLTYKGIVPLVIAMLCYFIMTFLLSRGLSWYEKKIEKKFA
ncbi:ABC transporter substrate-binding protein/permease [Aerococcus christensenii]|nr:ABC transporter substrate-binding protein/permease [Aerococcus christensenii]